MTPTDRLHVLYDSKIDMGDDEAAEQVSAYVEQVETGAITEDQALAEVGLLD